VFLEKRLAALREAVHLVVPAFEAFHASLNDEQKARLDSGREAGAGHAAQATSRRAYHQVWRNLIARSQDCSKRID